MKYKIFEMPTGKVLAMETKEFVEYYLQVNTSDWNFCCGCIENIDNITEEDAKYILEHYWDIVVEQESVLIDYINKKM